MMTLESPENHPQSVPHSANAHKVLSPGVRDFLERLNLQFAADRLNLLRLRRQRQQEFDRGIIPCFLPETRHIRDSDWTVASTSVELLDRRVEITGPTDRKMVINALNSKARVFMADFEDSTSPTWHNIIEGHQNLIDANCRSIRYTSAEGKQYHLNDEPAVLFVRPRGLHMEERHWECPYGLLSASFFDFGVYFVNNYRTLLDRGSAPYLYIPKLESHLEARLWNDIFTFAEDAAGIKRGSIRATVLIETITAAFEMDEILYELRDHSAGLNCGRWDYIFSFIKKFSPRSDFVLPQRGDITMEQPFLASYVQLLIETCHRRGTHAMGGMAAQIPIRHDPEANNLALEQARKDQLREVKAGHDGTWVAHPGLVPIATDIFNEHMPTPNQITHRPNGHSVSAAHLLEIATGRITNFGFRRNIDISITYLESWLRGIGCVPIFNLMEDAATAEISRAQLWQWNRYAVSSEEGDQLNAARIRLELNDLLEAKQTELGATAFKDSKFPQAAELLLRFVGGPFRPFLTTELYSEIP